MSPVIDENTEFGSRAARRLREEVVVWMTTVTPAGAPLPRPVWFVWDGDVSVVMYSQPGPRVRNLEANPRMTLNFDGNGQGGDIIVFSGTAAADPDTPADRYPEYLAKYDTRIARLGLTPVTFAERYSVPVRIRFTQLSGH